MQLSLLWLISVSLLLGGESSPKVLGQLTIAHAFSKEGSHLIKITTSKTYETEKRVYIRVNY